MTKILLEEYWNYSSYELKKFLLRSYYLSYGPVSKNYKLKWNKLPRKFKQYLMEEWINDKI